MGEQNDPSSSPACPGTSGRGAGNGQRCLPLAKERLQRPGTNNTTKQMKKKTNQPQKTIKTLLSPANLTLLKKKKVRGHPRAAPGHQTSDPRLIPKPFPQSGLLLLAAEVFYRYLYIYIFIIFRYCVWSAIPARLGFLWIFLLPNETRRRRQ